MEGEEVVGIYFIGYTAKWVSLVAGFIRGRSDTTLISRSECHTGLRCAWFDGIECRANVFERFQIIIII